MTPSESVTIRDVARAAGVSPGTVSRAMNNSPLVNEQTRQRILQVVESLNYTPHLVARRLSIGKALAVAVIVPFFTRPSVSERVNGAVSALSQTPYDLVIHDIETVEQRETGFEDMLRKERVDGALIISLPILDREVPLLASADVPVVLIDTDHPELPMLHRLTVDDVAGGRAATEHLIELGHRRIGFIGESIENPFRFISSRDRYYGYLRALRGAGLPFVSQYYAEDHRGRREARHQAQKMLSLPEPPTAIFAASDTQAIGVLEAAREKDLRVPEDLSVVGYDDIEMADVLDLTTVRQLLFESGQRGVELLLEALENPQMEPVHEVLPTEVIVRGSTAPPASHPLDSSDH
jgi:DNA-binding LacI/PurR family transcriptional regulator